MKGRAVALVWALCLILFPLSVCAGGEQRLAPEWPVPDYVKKLLSVAAEELGYTEKRDGTTKYGQWVNDPQAQWCAEYLCWSVDQTDKRYETGLLKTIYPLYSATNTGLNWFLREGRYVARKGFVNGWGSQWLTGSDTAMEPNSYVPQPGDWMFFSYTPSGDTTHVAMVEYCTKDAAGVKVHVLEGNNPDKVQRAQYDIGDWRILGYGTVHDVADLVLRSGNEGKKVRSLQEKLNLVGLLAAESVTGLYGQNTADAVRGFQIEKGLTPTGIANRATQRQLDAHVEQWKNSHNEYWIVDDGL